MAKWSNDIMDTWINYQITRNQLKTGIEVGGWLARSLWRLMTYMCQALVLWDCKMAKEMRSMFNTLLFNYITLEEIVLEATGAVAETPHTPGYISIYV